MTDMDQLVSVAESSLYEGWSERPYNPDLLYRKRGSYELFDKMRRDDAIAPLSLMKKLTILNSEWEVRTENDDVRDFFYNYAFDSLDKHLYGYFLEMLTCFDYGNSFTEPVFKLKETADGPRVCLVDLKTRAPHSMEYHTDKKGDIKFYRQLSDGADIDMKPGKYIHLVHNQEFQNPYGMSDFNEGVYTAWFSKQVVIKFMNIFLERYGAPTVIAKYKAGAPTRTEKSDMLKFVRNLSAKSGGVFSDKFDVSLLQGAAGQNPFIEAINMYNLMISRAMLNPDLTGFGGSETTGGSYALGEQQFDAWYMSLELPKKQLLMQFNKKIVKPLTLWNFGPEAAADVEFVMQTVSESRKAEQAKVYIEAVKSGVTPAVLEGINTLLTSIGYPEITEEDIEKAKPVSVQPPAEPVKEVEEMPGDMKEEPAETEEEDGEEIEADDDKDMKCGEKKKFTASRALTTCEKRVDFTRMENELDALDETWYKNIGTQFESSINAMVDHIRKRNIIDGQKMELVNELTVPHFGKIKSAFKGMLKASYLAGEASAEEAIPAKFAIEPVVALEDHIAWILAQAAMLASIESEEILRLAKPVLIDAIRTGKGTRETVAILDNVLKGWDMTVKAPRIETVVRTNVASAYNQARFERFSRVSADIQAYQYSAIMDTRTSDFCAAMDMKIISKVEAEQFNPPNHFNCRSTLIPIFIDEEPVQPDELPASKATGGSFMELA